MDRGRNIASAAGPPRRAGAAVIERGLDAILAAEAKRHDPAAAKPRVYALANTEPQASRYIPRDLVRQVWARDNHCCSWRTATGVCGSKHQLEIDHILALALGGKTELSNLRLVCREHNQMAARQAFGDPFIESKIEESRAQLLESEPQGVSTAENLEQSAVF
jgi:hypothetical protein